MNRPVDASSTLDVHCLLRIVDDLYAAACGEARWDQALTQVSLFGRLDGSALSAVDALERRWVVLASCGRVSQTKPGATHHPTIGDSLLVDSILKSMPGAVLIERQNLSDAVPAVTSPLSTDGVGSWACVVVGREERQVVCLEVYGGAGRAPGGPEPGTFLRQLTPHLVRAWRIGRASRAALAMSPHAASPPRLPDDVARAADLAGLPEVARLRAEFGLTKAEARLALHLAEGSSLASAAQAVGVKLTTIRSQLQQIFAKTGTSRQSELVAMLLSRAYGSRMSHWHPGRSGPAELALPG